MGQRFCSLDCSKPATVYPSTPDSRPVADRDTEGGGSPLRILADTEGGGSPLRILADTRLTEECVQFPFERASPEVVEEKLMSSARICHAACAPVQNTMPTEGESYEAARKVARFLVNRTARRRRFNALSGDLTNEVSKNKKKRKTNKLVNHLHHASQLARKGPDPTTAKLMDQKYWIEAADPKHRYGSRLVPYYKKWLQSGTSVGFFKWLDKGDGKDLDLEESPRAKLVASKVEYLDDAGRAECEVKWVPDVDGKLLMVYKKSGKIVDTPVRRCFCLYRIGVSSKYIFVADTNYNLYVHSKKTGFFHHSSFLSGRAARAAGGVVVRHGTLLAVNGNSGHYKPCPRMLDDVWGHLEKEYGFHRDDYLMVYPRTKRICPAFCKCIPTVPANFPW